MTNTTKQTTKNIAIGALIAALYVGFTWFSNIFGLAYGPVQFRISEAFTVLPVFTPAAVWGLTVGCCISNVLSFNPVDMIFGATATLVAALLTYLARNIKTFKLPLVSMLMPVIFNALIVGAEIAVFLEENTTLGVFAVSALWVGLGEIVTCVGLGSLLYTLIDKNKKLRALLS